MAPSLWLFSAIMFLKRWPVGYFAVSAFLFGMMFIEPRRPGRIRHATNLLWFKSTSELVGSVPPMAYTLDRDGFAVLGGFLDGQELRAATLMVDSILGAPCLHACRRPNNELFLLRWDSALVALFLGSVRRVRLVTRIADADDLKWISGYISIKAARSPPLWWHQDWWCWHHPVSYQRAPPQVAVFCYLSATDRLRGALRVLPGTHHKSAPIHTVLPEAHDEFAESVDVGHAAMSDQHDQVTLSVDAGDAVVTDYRLLHGTHANEGGARRDCVILNFAPSWQRLPEDIRAHLICHAAQPLESETAPPTSGFPTLLPAFDGPRKSLSLNRNAPTRFEIV